MSNESAAAKSGEYVVVARRYRPRDFQELVGQGQVAQALGNAITSNRVGHAYLFTGACGVGKTSTARILAKALNCVEGPTITPCNQCDVCLGVASGEDVDVLEIDGASNRGIDEVRQLRANVNVRPSRSRFKVYIIDEVHMLTTQAFNALLKTLEEPPAHVKFIFCTTDPEKLPITVLSRCQRFDFAPVQTDAIVERLRHIVTAEGLQAEDEALQLLARRAGGSMRDSQSLLEQLLSFCSEKVTVDDVHSMLGTARGGRLEAVGALLQQRDAAGALAEINTLTREGVDIGQFAEQLLGYYRDMMAAQVGCDAEMMLNTAPAAYDALKAAGAATGLETILAIMQIIDQTLMRMRQSVHGRALVEVAIVRICNLEDLESLSGLISQLQSGAAATAKPQRASRAVATAPPAKSPPASTAKTPSVQSPSVSAPSVPAPSVPAPAQSPAAQKPAPQKPAASSGAKPAGNSPPRQKKRVDPPTEAAPAPATSEKSGHLSADTAPGMWKQALANLGDMLADTAAKATRVAISAPNRLSVSFAQEYNFEREVCERVQNKQRLEQAVAALAGGRVAIEFLQLNNGNGAKQKAAKKTVVSRRQLMQDAKDHPFVIEATEMFEGELIDVKPPRIKRD